MACSKEKTSGSFTLAPYVRDKSWAELAALPWIGTPPASVHNRLLGRIFGELDVRQNVVALIDQEMSMLAMVRAGVGLSLCRESIALHEQQSNGLIIANSVKVETALSFISLKARMNDPAVAHVFEVARRIWEQSS